MIATLVVENSLTVFLAVLLLFNAGYKVATQTWIDGAQRDALRAGKGSLWSRPLLFISLR